MFYFLFIKKHLEINKKLKPILKIFTVVFFLSFCFPLLADRALIGLVTSRNEKVSYVSLAPLHYEAKKKGSKTIQVSPEDSFPARRAMELALYSVCNRGEPEEEAKLGFRASVLGVSLLLSPHPDDVQAAYYLLPMGWFRMLEERLRGGPYFQEKGIIKIASYNKNWEVNIQRTDVTAGNAKPDYSIRFSKESDEPLFIQALKDSARLKNQIPQVTIFLESPSLFVKATYALRYKGTKQYQDVNSMNIIDIWSRQQKDCPQ